MWKIGASRRADALRLNQPLESGRMDPPLTTLPASASGTIERRFATGLEELFHQASRGLEPIA
jgi:hypothetical protein